MTGRPTEYNEKKARAICVELSAGRSLRSVCEDAGMPDKATVFRWVAMHDDFRDQYARAREAQSDAMLDECLDIADQFDNLQDKLDVEHINRAKLRIDTRKWAMSKMAPKKYGEKLDLNHAGKVDADVTHHGEIAVSATTEFIAQALGARADATPEKPGKV